MSKYVKWAVTGGSVVGEVIGQPKDGNVKIALPTGQELTKTEAEVDYIDENVYQAHIKNLVNTLKTKANIKEGDTMTDTKADNFEQKITELQAEINKLTEANKELVEANEQYKKDVEKMKEKDKELETTKAELVKVKQSILGERRFNELVQLKANEAIDKDENKAKEALGSMSDTEFARIVSVAQVIRKSTEVTSTSETKSTDVTESDKKKSSEAITDALASAKTKEDDLVIDSTVTTQSDKPTAFAQAMHELWSDNDKKD